MDEYTDGELIAELVHRNGLAPSPMRVSRLPKYFSDVIVADGKDNTVIITLENDGPILKGIKNGK